MLLYAINELQVSLQVETPSPLLIKDGRLTDDLRKEVEPDKKQREKMPAALPISRNTVAEIKSIIGDRTDPLAPAKKTLRYFIPGTSLRGAWRAHLERTLRGIDPGQAKVCDPLDGLDEGEGTTEETEFRACSKVLDDKRKEFEKANRSFPAYRLSCPVCKLFGNTTLGSRLAISDGEPDRLGCLIQREHIRINRHNGQATGAVLKFFAIQDAVFSVSIRLRNFELWHITLLGILLKDLSNGLVPVGSGKSKGYGQVRGKVTELRLTAFGSEPDMCLRGVAEDARFGEQFQRRYGIRGAAQPPQIEGGRWDPVTPIRFERLLDLQSFNEVWPRLPLQWNDRGLLAERKAAHP